MIRTTLAVWLLLLLLLVACTPEQGEGSSSTGEASGGTAMAPTTGEANVCEPARASTDDCCCFAIEVAADQQSAQVLNSCPSAALCPEFAVQCSFFDPDCPLFSGGDLGPGELTVDDPEALDCALAALRDGAVGRLAWTVNPADQVTYAVTYDIAAGRVVFTQRTDRDDFRVEYGDVREQALAAPEKFAACLAAPELRDRIQCLKGVTTDAVAATCATGTAIPPL